jgi:hypothetical protein
MTQGRDGRRGKCGCGCESLTTDRIRERAYEIFQARGGRGGDPCADWLQAERELKAAANTRESAEPAPIPMRPAKRSARSVG